MRQAHIQSLWMQARTLSRAQKRQLQRRLCGYPADLFARQCASFKACTERNERLRPPHRFFRSGRLDLAILGQQLLRQGRVGCVILAGGQGNRLGWSGPKALFPLFAETTLLQILLNKIKRLSQEIGRPLPVAVMTSPADYVAIERALAQERVEIPLFCQSTMPLLNEAGEWFLDPQGEIAEGPDGNGGVFVHLAASEILQQWEIQGVSYITTVHIDNPLAAPFDLQLLGLHHQQQVDCVVKCMERLSLEEKSGLVGTVRDRLRIAEYNELFLKSQPDGNEWPLSYSGMLSFSLPFVKKVAALGLAALPLHIARKTARALWVQEPIRVVKLERFLFDVLEYATTVEALLFPRSLIYAPVKNRSGDDSPESVRAQLAPISHTLTPHFSHSRGKFEQIFTPSFVNRSLPI